MFTGIVEELGRVRDRTPTGDGYRFTFEARRVVEDSKVGDSISVARTNLGELGAGDAVNLERPVRLTDRLGGHLVQGHVDAVGEVVRGAPDLRVRAPSHLLRYVVEKGSIAVDGCSLTVVARLEDGFTVAVIPHTAAETTLGRKGPGDSVNLEADVVAKYVERLLEPVSSQHGR